MLDERTKQGIRDGTVDTRALRREATRSRILEAAWRLARRDGLAALTVRELAAEVGMRAPSLYWYFPSKNDIYDAMYTQALRQLGEDLEGGPTGSDPLEDLRRGARRFVRANVKDPCRYELIFQRPIPDFVPSSESFAIGVKGLGGPRAALEAVGVRGERALDLWRALMNGLIGQQIANDPGGDRWTRLVDDAVDMFVMYHAAAPPRAQAKRSPGGSTRKEKRQ